MTVDPILNQLIRKLKNDFPGAEKIIHRLRHSLFIPLTLVQIPRTTNGLLPQDLFPQERLLLSTELGIVPENRTTVYSPQTIKDVKEKEEDKSVIP